MHEKLSAATVVVSFALRVERVSHAGLKSGHASPVNERGAVSINVHMRIRAKNLNILATSKSPTVAMAPSMPALPHCRAGVDLV